MGPLLLWRKKCTQKARRVALESEAQEEELLSAAWSTGWETRAGVIPTFTIPSNNFIPAGKHMNNRTLGEFFMDLNLTVSAA